MALTTAWIETLRTGVYERCSALDLNPLSIGFTPAHSLTENEHTGIILKSATPQGIESAIKTLAPYFYNQLLWDIDDPDTWTTWTSRTLWEAAYQGFFVPHEQTAVLSNVQLDENWYLTMKAALNLLQYTPYTSQRKGLGQSGGGGDEQTKYYDLPGVPRILPEAANSLWTGELSAQTENDSIFCGVWGMKYTHGVNSADYYGHVTAVETGPVATPPLYTYGYWSWLWLAGKNIVEYKEDSIPAKPFASTIRRYHKKAKDSGFFPWGYTYDKIVMDDVTIEEGWDCNADQSIAADTEATYEELIQTELNDLNPQEPDEIQTNPGWDQGQDGFWGQVFSQYNCSAHDSASVKRYAGINFPSFAAWRKYEFTVL